jgi:hypothetical protein
MHWPPKNVSCFHYRKQMFGEVAGYINKESKHHCKIYIEWSDGTTVLLDYFESHYGKYGPHNVRWFDIKLTPKEQLAYLLKNRYHGSND